MIQNGIPVKSLCKPRPERALAGLGTPERTNLKRILEALAAADAP